MTKSFTSYTFQITLSDGDIYEVTKQGWEEWLISYPEGGKRFFGNKSEVKDLIKNMIKRFEDDQ